MCIEVKAANLILVSISGEWMRSADVVSIQLPMVGWLTIQMV